MRATSAAGTRPPGQQRQRRGECGAGGVATAGFVDQVPGGVALLRGQVGEEAIGLARFPSARRSAQRPRRGGPS